MALNRGGLHWKGGYLLFGVAVAQVRLLWSVKAGWSLVSTAPSQLEFFLGSSVSACAGPLFLSLESK